MFQFKEINAKLSNANVRAEIHGEDTKIAVDLSFELRGPNSILEDLAPGLLQAIYRKAEEGEDQQGELDLDPQRLSKLTFPDLQQPLKWDKEYSGYTFTMHYGINESSNLVLGTCQVDKWKFECQDGGTVITTFRVIAHPEEDQIGHLCKEIQQNIVLSLIPPTAQYYKDGKLPGTGGGSGNDGDD